MPEVNYQAGGGGVQGGRLGVCGASQAVDSVIPRGRRNSLRDRCAARGADAVPAVVMVIAIIIVLGTMVTAGRSTVATAVLCMVLPRS